MICSARDFSSSGLSGAESSAMSSAFTRMVAGRPTFSSRSDALRWTISVIAALKLKVAWLVCGASGMGIDSEEGLAELDGLGVLHQHFPDDPGDLGLDFVHDLHRFDDAHHLPRRHPASRLHIQLRTRLGRGVVRPHHRGFDLQEVGRRRGRRGPPSARGRGRPLSCCGGGPGVRDRWGLRDHDMPATRVCRVPGLRHPHRGPRPEQTPTDLDRPELRRVLQDLHQLRDDVEVHGSQSYTSSTRSVSPSDSSSALPPSGGKWTSSSMRTPPSPARYTPGSTVTTAPPGSGSALVFDSRGASCTSSPNPWPSEWPNASPKPRAAIGSRARASASRPLIPARTPARARRCAPCTTSYRASWRSLARAPTTTVRVMSAQYPSTCAPKSSNSHSPVATVRPLDRACGSALRGPEATMVENGCPSLPSCRRAPSSTPAIASSVMPARTSLSVRRRASPASRAALRMAATSPSSLAARSRSTSSVTGRQRHALPASANRCASCTESTCAS